MKLSDEIKETLYFALSDAFHKACTLYQCEQVHAATVAVGLNDLAETFLSDMRDLARDKDFPLT